MARQVVGWSTNANMTAQLVADAVLTAFGGAASRML